MFETGVCCSCVIQAEITHLSRLHVWAIDVMLNGLHPIRGRLSRPWSRKKSDKTGPRRCSQQSEYFELLRGTGIAIGQKIPVWWHEFSVTKMIEKCDRKSVTGMRENRGYCFVWSAARSAIISMAILVFLSPWVAAQQPTNSIGNDSVSSAVTTQTIRPVSTDSPRDTLSTFFWLRDKLEVALLDYSRSSSVEGAQQVLLLQAQLRSLVDLSMVPSSSRVQVGNDTIGYLLDIFGRMDALDLDLVPDDAAFEDDGLAQYRIPRTPIRIMRLDDGPREGEFVFNSRTVGIAQRVFRSVEHLPLSSDLEITSWAGLLPQLTGPYIPPSLVQAVPSQLRVLWLDTPIWKIIATFVIASIAALLAIMVGRWVSRVEAETEVQSLAWRLIRPLAILIITVVLIPVIDLQINTFGRFDGLVDLVAISLIYFASA